MRTNLRMIAAASAFAIAAFAQPAAAADIFPEGTPAAVTNPANSTFEVVGDPFSGPISATIGNAGLAAGVFTDNFIFRIGQNGLGGGSFTTQFSGSVGNPTDLDFLSAVFNNGVQNFIIPLGAAGSLEFGNLSNIPIFFGNTNTLSIEFRSRGNGSYGGELNFIPTSPVPEPATWALMLLGFAGVGMAMRRRRKETVRVKYAF